MKGTCVWNARYDRDRSWEFKAFVDTTGYPNNSRNDGDSYVFHLLVEPEKEQSMPMSGSPWWLVARCLWTIRLGRSLQWKRGDEPSVVHISLQDVQHCDWASWEIARHKTCNEYAARGRCSRFHGGWPQKKTEVSCQYLARSSLIRMVFKTAPWRTLNKRTLSNVKNVWG